MDPLSAIGLASAVVQFIEFGLRVVSRLDEFNSKTAGDVPRSLQAIHTQLPLLLNALSRIKSDSELRKLDFDTKCILRGMVTGCSQQITEVERMITEISRTPGDSFKVKIKKVFVSLRYDEKVWEIERNLHTYISVLTLHHVIDSADAPLELAEDTFFDVREKRISPFVERPVLMRELEDNLRDAAWSQITSPAILLLSGEKGVGKTQLAVEYCHQARSEGHFKTVFWVDASSIDNLSLGFESIYAIIKRSVDGSRPEKINFVTDFLNDLWHPWLLILDNYDASALYNNIMEFIPTRGSGGVIFISRTQENGLGKVLHIPRFIAAQDQARLNSLLTQEVQNKNIDGIKSLVEQGADVNTLIWNEWPCLHRAALFGLEDAVAFLLERGADANPPLAIRKPIYWAASGGSEPVCRLLLDHEDKTGELATLGDYQSAFNAAVEEGCLRVVRLLVTRREIQVNGKGKYDETPIQTACKKGHVELLEYLIEQGALKEELSQGGQALISASSSGRTEIVKILLTSAKIDLDIEDGNGNTPLSYAASLKDAKSNTYEEGGFELIQLLLSHGASPNFIGRNNDGPVNTAAIHNHIKKLRLLLDNGGNPLREANGWSPLTNAMKYNSPEALTILLQANCPDESARQAALGVALRYAARSGQRSAVLQLLEAGADINASSDAGVPVQATPLLLAVLSGEVKTAQYLIRQKARQDLPDAEGRFPLLVAAENGHEQLVRDLIKAGGDPDMKSRANGDTPLILAAGKGHEKVVRVLLAGGAGRDVGNRFGDVALDVAEEKGFEKVIEALEEVRI